MPALSVPSVRIIGSLAALALVQACSSQPQLSASGEASRYRLHARGNYNPPGPEGDPWGPYIREAANKFDVPQDWVRAVMHQESGGHLFRHGELITSGAGAMGLMQVMPATYDELRSRYPDLGEDPFDPHDNIMAGTAYLREMYDIYGSPGFLAAYNAGPGRLDDYLTRNRPLPAETRRYVAAISPNLGGNEPRRGSPGAQFAMNALPAAIPAGTRYPAAPSYAAPVAYAESRPTPVELPPAPPAPEPAPVLVAMNANPPPEPPPEPLPEARPVPAVVPVAAQAAPQPAPAALPLPPPLPVSRPAYTPPPLVPVQVAELPDEALPDSEPMQPEPRRATRPSSREERLRDERAAREVLRLPPVRVAAREALPLPPTLPANMPFQMASASQRPVPGSRGFHLFTPAMAEPIMPHRGDPGATNWAIQVGAFASSNMAAAASAAARDEARGDLGHARGSVTEVRQGHDKLYRARFQGLSRDGAARVCERLARQRTSCMVVSPDAQS